MPVCKVTVKWGKEKFENVTCNTEEPPLVLKAAIFSLSGVQPDRQKLMYKGAVIKDYEWGKVELKDNVTLLMMGSADELPVEPTTTVMFVEDMSETQLARAPLLVAEYEVVIGNNNTSIANGAKCSVMTAYCSVDAHILLLPTDYIKLELPAGLANLGNTCYMNATIQCLRSVPELCDAMEKFRGSSHVSAVQPDLAITAAMRDLFETMNRSSGAIPPIMMLNILHMCFPRFAEKGEHGGFQQQDANECWIEIVRSLQHKLPSISDNTDVTPSAQAGASATRGFVDQYFGGEYETTMTCLENADETPVITSECFFQLSCFIDKEVKYLQSGLKAGLEGELIKKSPSLGRDSRYQKMNKIKRLPAYLTVQILRFSYKAKEAINAKILKDIKFPISLDVFDLCTSDLQRKLTPARDAFKADEDRRAEQVQKDKQKGGKSLPTNLPDKPIKKAPFSFPDDVGSNNSGYYELQAVLTHKGRSSSSGHYVAWVKGKKNDEWLMFDDDKVSAVTSEDILKLSGGGDWHSAYVLLYGPRVLEEADAVESSDDMTS